MARAAPRAPQCNLKCRRSMVFSTVLFRVPALLLVLLIGARASVRTPGVTYRSIIGDPEMRWKGASDTAEGLSEPARHSSWLQRKSRGAHVPSVGTRPVATAETQVVVTQGPRMQLFFYGLCSKAGYSNVSVLPEPSDTCETKPGVEIGLGTVSTVNATDCCAACLAEPWCLAWTQTGERSCALKDNALAVPLASGETLPTLGHPKTGFCGQTRWSTGCNDTARDANGAWKAKDHGITTLAECVAMCETCPSCNFVSFSPTNDGTGDCSWYSSCTLEPEGDYMSARVRNSTASNILSGVRRYKPAQELPSPRYGNCIVNGKQTVTETDNAAIGAPGVDAEWFAVQKETTLGELCEVPLSQRRSNEIPSHFWTVMSQNGNDPSNVGTLAECLPYCYLTPPGGVHPNPPKPFGYPPAVNASFARCDGHKNQGTSDTALAAQRRRLFDGLPQNQAKVMIGYTDGNDKALVGSFNWTFSLAENLAVPEHEFPMDVDLGIWSWRYDEVEQKGIVRIYQRVSEDYPWLCTYFGADIGEDDGRGMMTEAPIVGDFLVRFFLNITKSSVSGPGWYAPNMEACWDQVTGKNCRPYGDTNRMVHQQVLLDYGNGGNGGPPFHILLNGTVVPRGHSLYPQGAYKEYCCPCTSCSECAKYHTPCCDPLSNPNGQSIYKIHPHPVWAVHGFPANRSDGFIGNPKMHELNVGCALGVALQVPRISYRPHVYWLNQLFIVLLVCCVGVVGVTRALWKQIWFPCMATEPIEIITINIGPETGLGGGTHDTEFYISDFDILVPATAEDVDDEQDGAKESDLGSSP